MNVGDWIQRISGVMQLSLSRRLRGLSKRRLCASQLSVIDLLEPRLLLTSDLGDAPDVTAGTAANDYQTVASNNGPSHVIDGTMSTLFLGSGVDGDIGDLQGRYASLDDQFAGDGFDDEDGVMNALDLISTVGAEPVVTLQATNQTGDAATLWGWIDFNHNGQFENATERTQMAVPAGTTNGRFTLTFPMTAGTSAGHTYARFRLSSDAAASDATGSAIGGEVEDYPFEIRRRVAVPVEPVRLVKISTNANNGPTLAPSDLYGISTTGIGDVDGNGVPDFVVGAPGDDTGGTNRGAVYVTLMNSDGSAKSSVKIASELNGGPSLADNDYFGVRIASLGDLDGDGITDIAVGAYEEANGDTGRSGSVYIIRLLSDGTAKSFTRIAGSLNGGPMLSDGDGFSSVASLGDLDGDGVVDLAVGAPGADVAIADQGLVYILHLKKDGTVRDFSTIENVDSTGLGIAGDEFGISVTNLGDLDGDGIREIAVLANTQDFGSRTGNLHIISLNGDGSYRFSSLISSNVYMATSLTSMGYMHGIASIGDIDGDGVKDLALTMDSMSYAGEDSGVIFLITMNQDGTAKDYGRIGEETSGAPSFRNESLSVSSLSWLGDTNGDGSPELLVGMPYDGATDSATGSLYVLSLATVAPYTSVPDVPAIQEPAAHADQVRPQISWSEVPHATRYEIWLRSDSKAVTLVNSESLNVNYYTPNVDLEIGRYSVSVRARNENGYSAWSAQYRFSVNTSVTVNPIPDSVNRRPTVTWNSIPGAIRYDIWMRNFNPTAATPIRFSTTDGQPTFTPVANLVTGTWVLYVRGVAADGSAGAWSQGIAFRVGLPVDVPTITNQFTRRPTIAWNAVAGAATYDIWISNVQTPGTPRLRTQTTSADVRSFTPTADLPTGRYVTWVRALAADGTPGAWSVAKGFDAGLAPVFVVPDAEVHSRTQIHLAWSAVEGAASYEVWIDDPAPGLTPAEIGLVRIETGTALDYRRFLQGRYSVWVRAVGADGLKGVWSDVGVRRSRDTVTGLMQVNARNVSHQPKFSWDNTYVARYEIQIDDVSRKVSKFVHVSDVTSLSFTVPDDLPIGDFHIWVRGISADGTFGYWSQAVEFSYRPKATLVALPTTFIQTPELEWNPVDGAADYDIVVRNLDNGRTLFQSRNLAATSVTTTVLPEGRYRWWVAANGTDGVHGDWSDGKDFIIDSSTRLVVPSTINVTSGESFLLRWTPVFGADHYEVLIQDHSRTVYLNENIATAQYIVTEPLQLGVWFRIWVRAISTSGGIGRWSNQGTSMLI
jgi:hypothetical protein